MLFRALISLDCLLRRRCLFLVTYNPYDLLSALYRLILLFKKIIIKKSVFFYFFKCPLLTLLNGNCNLLYAFLVLLYFSLLKSTTFFVILFLIKSYIYKVCWYFALFYFHIGFIEMTCLYILLPYSIYFLINNNFHKKYVNMLCKFKNIS